MGAIGQSILYVYTTSFCNLLLYNHSRETLHVNILKEYEPGRLKEAETLPVYLPFPLLRMLLSLYASAVLQ
jgi:hypothetical protein